MNNQELAFLYANCFPNDRHLWSEVSIAQMRHNHLCVIFEIDYGALFLQKAADEAELLSIFIHPDFCKQGKASGLMSQAIEHCISHGIRSIFLEVAVDNQSALSFYRKFGFDLIGKRKEYYERKNGIRIDALTMRLDL